MSGLCVIVFWGFFCPLVVKTYNCRFKFDLALTKKLNKFSWNGMFVMQSFVCSEFDPNRGLFSRERSEAGLGDENRSCQLCAFGGPAEDAQTEQRFSLSSREASIQEVCVPSFWSENLPQRNNQWSPRQPSSVLPAQRYGPVITFMQRKAIFAVSPFIKCATSNDSSLKTALLDRMINFAKAASFLHVSQILFFFLL